MIYQLLRNKDQVPRTTDRWRRKNRGCMMKPPGLGPRTWEAKSQALEIMFHVSTLRTYDFEFRNRDLEGSKIKNQEWRMKNQEWGIKNEVWRMKDQVSRTKDQRSIKKEESKDQDLEIVFDVSTLTILSISILKSFFHMNPPKHKWLKNLRHIARLGTDSEKPHFTMNPKWRFSCKISKIISSAENVS